MFLKYFSVFGLAVAAGIYGHDSISLKLPEKVVTFSKPYTAASSQDIRDLDLSLRVILEPADLLKVTPGLYVSQHAGGGKAHQYFIRGFDGDHGTDIAFWFDGMPVNNVSHGHGQGYTDMHFIIPELVNRVEMKKGPYFSEYGDFATAGAVHLHTHQPRESFLSLQTGMFHTYRALGLVAGSEEAFSPTIAAEVYRTDAYFDNPDDMERYNLFMRSNIWRHGEASLGLTLMGYGSGWNGSGQIPLRAVEDGSLSRYGSVDPTEGGNSQRHSASLRFDNQGERDYFQATAYLINYRLALYSNFTFFAGDSEHGDQIEQNDRRLVAGFHAGYGFENTAFGMLWRTRMGVESRNDIIHNELGQSVRRKRFTEDVNSDVRQGSFGVYAQEEVEPLPWLRLIAGIRADYYGFDVTDRLEERDPDAPKTSGVQQASIFSPKASAVISPMQNWQLYLNFGEGFHSNDARGIVLGNDPVTPLSKARGYEFGTRTRLWDRLDLAAALWRLALESELVWVGDEGVTEPRGETRRIGADLEARVSILPWLWLDGDITLADAVFTENPGNAQAVALAPTLAATGGIAVSHPSGFFGSLRLAHLGDRPATEDESITADGFAIVNLGVGYRRGNWEVHADVANLFDTEWSEVQFVNESQLPGETGPVEDIHFVPGTPFQVVGGVKLYF